MKFIFDTKLIDQSVEKYGYNPKKLPLGKLSKDTIVKGYSILKEIDNAIKSKAKSDKLSKLSAEFYQNIPHNFGYQNMSHFVIDTQDKLKEKLDLMDSLCDIRITAKINESAKDNTQDENELDVKYKKLKCMIEPLNPTTDEYKVLAKSLNINEVDKKKKNIKVLEIFKVSKKDEETKVPKKSDKDRKLILHGASLSRWGGILSKGIGSKADFAKTERSKFKSEPEISDKTGQSADFTRYYMSNNIGLLALCDIAVDTSKKQKHDGLGELDKIVTTRNDASKYNDSSSKQLKTLLKEKKGCCHQSGMKAYDMGDVQLKYLYKCQFI